MLIFPYSTALSLARPPVVTYATAVLCFLIFQVQLNSGITETLMYYPESWNPLKMITQSLLHGGWMHLIGNLLFYIAFAPALELIIGNTIRYIWIMVFIAIVSGFSYSFSVIIGNSPNLPSLGFSGVVMGMIGLSAYLMPQARIKVFWWFILGWKTFHVPAWILAAIYIGLDTWTMLTARDYGGINVVAHVSGGIAGYLYGYLWLKERKEDVREELEHEIKVMNVERKQGRTQAEALRYKDTMEQRQTEKKQQQDHDRFMGTIYKMVTTHRDSDAVYTLISRYNLDTTSSELDALYERIKDWGPSRTQLCLGRLIIQKLDSEKRYGRAILYLEKCQSVSPQFILPDISRTLFYAAMAIDTGKPEVAKHLLVNPQKRYGTLLNPDQCNHLLQKAANLNKA